MIKPFVDRTEEIKQLNQALKYDRQESPVLVFTGIGGMGKTALRIAFEEQVLKPNKVPYAVLDYDGDPNLRPIEATLRAIRRQLGRHKVKTPVFDFLYARYFELSTGLKISAKNCPIELEGVVSILEGIPIVSNVTQILYGLGQLGLGAKERLQHKEWLYRIRDLEPREVLSLLPEVLAEDLEEAMTLQKPKILKSSGFRIPLFLDAYERLSESQVDDTLHRKLLLLTPHLLRVIFARDTLPWKHQFPQEWQGKITHFPTLEVLARKDAKIFLKEKSVDNPDLQEHLYQLTDGFPFHLELCADICREIEETTEREAGIEDFEGAAQAKDLTEELVERLLRQLKDNERDLMELAAYPRWVTEEILEVLSSVPESVPRIFKKFIRLSMFSLHPEIPEAYVIRKEVRSFLISRQKQERLWQERHKKLATFHKERWKETQSFHYFLESLYHGFYENPDPALKIFGEHFWKLLEKYNFGEAEGLLEAIPQETLSEEMKRKVDYARARLLTSSSRSHASLIIAQKLYKTLIASEKDEVSLSKYLFYYGQNLYILGEYDKALEYYQKSLAIRLQIYGEQHPDVAASYNNIGDVYDELGKCEKALEYYQKSLAIRLQIYGEQHPDVAVSYNNIGGVYIAQGKYEKALEYHQKSLAISLKVYGEQHPDVAASYNNIGGVYIARGKYEKAMEYFQKSLAISLKVYGKQHPEIATSYNNIGGVYNELGKYEKALEYFQKSLAIRLQIYGEQHPEIATSYNNIGCVYDELGKCEKALEYHQKSLAIRLKVYGKEHPGVATSYNNIGLVYDKQGKYEKALEYFQRSLAIVLQVYGKQHPNVTNSYNNIGFVYHDLGKYEKALEYYQKSLAIVLKLYGKEHPDVAGSYKNIARTLWTLGQEEEAFKKAKESIEIYRKFKLWKDVVEGLKKLASWLTEKGKKKAAEETLKKAQKIRQDHNLS